LKSPVAELAIVHLRRAVWLHAEGRGRWGWLARYLADVQKVERDDALPLVTELLRRLVANPVEGGDQLIKALNHCLDSERTIALVAGLPANLVAPARKVADALGHGDTVMHELLQGVTNMQAQHEEAAKAAERARSRCKRWAVVAVVLAVVVTWAVATTFGKSAPVGRSVASAAP
jgi:hypothetical protein